MGTCCSIQEDKSNYARLCRLLISIGTPVYRNVFNKILTPDSLQTLVNKPNIKNTFKELKSKGALKEDQWNKIYPSVEASTDVSSSGLDITLLSFLLKSICSLKRPATGWDNVPLDTDVSTEADLARITSCRNRIHDNASSICDKDFLDYWREIEDTLIRLGGDQYKEDIDKLKCSPISLQDKGRFIQSLGSWKEEEEKLMKTMEEIGNGIKGSDTVTVQDVDAYMNSLKSSVKSYTENLPNYSFNTMVTMKTEEIFTIKISDTTTSTTQERNDQEVQERNDQNAQEGNDQEDDCFEIEKSSDLFINNRDENPTRLIIMAGQGVGKSLFCMKLLRDWSVGQLFVDNNNGPNLKFAYFLTFRELNLMENLSLTDLLNLSSMLDPDCVVDDALVAYFVQHSEQVLILMDGIDEFAHYHQIGSAFDNQYPDDAHVQLPVAVLCAKLLQRKLLPQSVVMVTSRPDEGMDAMQKVHFDRYLKISSSTTKNVSGPFRYQFW